MQSCSSCRCTGRRGEGGGGGGGVGEGPAGRHISFDEVQKKKKQEENAQLTICESSSQSHHT